MYRLPITAILKYQVTNSERSKVQSYLKKIDSTLQDSRYTNQNKKNYFNILKICQNLKIKLCFRQSFQNFPQCNSLNCVIVNKRINFYTTLCFNPEKCKKNLSVLLNFKNIFCKIYIFPSP